eukprot:TRINITY_DN21343_c0_g1_i1.p1 TRINITY_DN21343_c0_g1~~TRINITY_DN21343_c0_g1_i1.p1  ORF type:complete len:350 (-),score=40.78 TRINITY_DN21343_c0_g1_i1:1147-2196(-)
MDQQQRQATRYRPRPSAPPPPNYNGGPGYGNNPGQYYPPGGAGGVPPGGSPYGEEMPGGGQANRRPYRPITVGEHITKVCMDSLRGTFLRFAHITARVDLVRPYGKRYRGGGHTFSSEEEQGRKNGPQGALVGGAYDPPYGGPQQPGVDRSISGRSGSRARGYGGWMPGGNLIEGRGARLKLMQIWDFPDKETGYSQLPWGLNLGVGMNFDIDASKLEPRLRVRAEYGALHILPRPELEFRGRYNIPIGALAVDMRCRIPLSTFAEPFGGEKDLNSPGPRLMVSLFHSEGSGVHLTPGGLEFDERVWRIGQHTGLRVAAMLGFPRQIPFDESDPLKIHVTRLGLKTRLS